MLLAEEEVGLDEVPQELLQMGSSYEEVIGQLRGARGLEDDASFDADAGGAGYERAARAMEVSEETLRAPTLEAPTITPMAPRRGAAAGREDAALRARGAELGGAADGAVAAMPAVAGARAAKGGKGAAASGGNAGAAAADARAAKAGSVAGEADGAAGAGAARARGRPRKAQQGAGAADGAAALAAAAAADNGSLVEEAPDAALTAFDHAFEGPRAFDFDQQRATLAAADDVAAAAPIGLAAGAARVRDGMAVVDEAPDAALTAFDHAEAVFQPQSQDQRAPALHAPQLPERPAAAEAPSAAEAPAELEGQGQGQGQQALSALAALAVAIAAAVAAAVSNNGGQLPQLPHL